MSCGWIPWEPRDTTFVPEYSQPATTCLRAERDRAFLEATLTAAYNIHGTKAARPLPAAIRRILDARDIEEDAMELTMREYLTMVGREDKKEEDRLGTLVSLRKAFTLRGVAPRAYARDVDTLADAKEVSRLIVSFMAAKNPRAYLKRRFGH